MYTISNFTATQSLVGDPRAGQFSSRGAAPDPRFSIINRFDYFYQSIVRVSGVSLSARPNALIPFGRVSSPIGAFSPGSAAAIVVELRVYRGCRTALDRGRVPSYRTRARIARPGELYEDLTGGRDTLPSPPASPPRCSPRHEFTRRGETRGRPRSHVGEHVHPPAAGNANTCIRGSLTRWVARWLVSMRARAALCWYKTGYLSPIP